MYFDVHKMPYEALLTGLAVTGYWVTGYWFLVVGKPVNKAS